MAVNLEQAKAELADIQISDSTRRLIEAAFRMIEGLDLELLGGPFICGEGGTKDKQGLPEYVMVCPQYGAAGSCFYKKHSEYSEPGY